MNDWQLLQDYAKEASEAAFRSLVDRYLGLVYAAALRQTNNPPLAEEVSQAVFILLARKAPKLRQNVVLAGWLFRTTRFVAARACRGEQRRQRREQEALEMQELSNPGDAWSRVAPVLDEALEKLGKSERDAVLLRYVQNQSYPEVGAALGLNEEAARKRVNRAVEKLRGFFAGRGFTISGGMLVSLLAANAAKGTPPSLAGEIAGASATGAAGTGMGASLSLLVSQTLHAWLWAKIRLAGVVALGVAVVIGLPLVLNSKRLGDSKGAMRSATAQIVRTELKPVAVRPSRTGAPARRQTEQVLRFRVVARDTGEPVTNATLAVNTVSGASWESRFDLATDQNGAAEVPYPHDAGRLDVGLLSSGWAARFATWTPGRGDSIPAEYLLRVDRVTNWIGGWIRDAQDRPVAGAELMAHLGRTGDSSNRETPRERFGFISEAVVARSDSQGWWTCALIPSKDHRGFQISATHPDFRKTDVVVSDVAEQEDLSANQRLRQLWSGQLVTHLDAGITLSGRVLDEAGQPIARALVCHDPFATGAVPIETDEAGAFSIPKLGEGEFDIVASAEAFAPEYRMLRIEMNMPPIEFRLKAGAVLRLRVVDEGGLPVTGATVGLEQWGEHRHKLKWAAESDVTGVIQWDSAPLDGELEIYAKRAGWCYTRNIRLKADGQEHEIRMRPELIVTGTVCDAATGLPVAALKAIPGYGDGPYMWERLDTRSGIDGVYKIVFSEDKQPWRVRIEAEGYAPFVSAPLDPDLAGPLNASLQRLDASAGLSGVVWRPDNKPAVGAEVALITLEHDVHLERTHFRRDPSDTLIVLTDEQGRFSFAADPKAHTIVAASDAGFARLRVRPPLKPMSMRLLPWGRIEGSIDARLRQRGTNSAMVETPTAGQQFGTLSLGWREARPDAEGRFVLETLPPERLCLYLNPGVGSPFHHRTWVTVLPEQTTMVAVTNSGYLIQGRFSGTTGQPADWSKLVSYGGIQSNRKAVLPPSELSGDARKFWELDFWESEAGRTEQDANSNVPLKVLADGSFEVSENFVPGPYELKVLVGERWVNREISLPPTNESAPLKIDLGVIPVDGVLEAKAK